MAKVQKSKIPFVMIPNATAQDPNLKASSLGLLTYGASLPDDWELRDGAIQRHFGIGRDALRSIWQNLTVAGYLQRRKTRNDDGKFSMETTIFIDCQCGLTVGGKTTSGQTVGGEPTPKQINNNKKTTQKEIFNSNSSSARLSFESEFGFFYPAGLDRLLDEHRAVLIAKKEKLSSDLVRIAVAELAAESIRGFRSTAAAAWCHLCRQQSKENTPNLSLSLLGEGSIPSWN